MYNNIDIIWFIYDVWLIWGIYNRLINVCVDVDISYI